MLATLGNFGRKSERKRHLANDFVFRTTALAAREEVDLLGDDLAAIALLAFAVGPARVMNATLDEEHRAPAEYGPPKTIYNRFIRWSRLGVFDKIFAALAAKGGKPDQLMIDATHLKAHRTAASLLKKGLFPDVSGAPRAA